MTMCVMTQASPWPWLRLAACGLLLAACGSGSGESGAPLVLADAGTMDASSPAIRPTAGGGSAGEPGMQSMDRTADAGPVGRDAASADGGVDAAVAPVNTSDAAVCQGDQALMFEHAMPTIWLVIDGSGAGNLLSVGGETWWTALRAALLDSTAGVIARRAQHVKWGVMVFNGPSLAPSPMPAPGFTDPNDCLHLITVAPARDNRAAIEDRFPATAPGGTGPAHRALASLADTLGAAPITAPTKVVLVTDFGATSDVCGNVQLSTAEVRPQVAASVARLAGMGVQTHVLTLSIPSDETPDTSMVSPSDYLESLHYAGGSGTPLPIALTRAQIGSVLETLSSDPEEACDLPLQGRITGAPPCPGELELGTAPIACDATDGAAFPDAYTLRLAGRACDAYLGADPAVLSVRIPCAKFIALDARGACRDAARCGCESEPVSGRWGTSTGGELLVFFDRSASMGDDWKGMPKVAAARALLEATLDQLAADVRVAGVFFPSAPLPAANVCPCDNNNPMHWVPGPGACCLNPSTLDCVVSPLTSDEQIAFTTRDDFRAKLATRSALSSMSQASPLGLALDTGAAALLSASSSRRAALLLTDGSPTCNDTARALEQTLRAWAAQDIPTFVAEFAGEHERLLLHDLAAAGGTRTAYAPDERTRLSAQLSARLAAQPGGRCSFELSESVPGEYLHLEGSFEGERYDLSGYPDARGFARRGARLVLSEPVCEALLTGRVTELRVTVGCTSLPRLSAL